ncbi:hypothetical protein [Paenibacillus sinopodophylli]|uniref:hypothetical protein n=1 Tax=Paenibacillus sinopodophylli TaxID=1837342 RepID=UPI00148627ED|nr:hypothetical protein [Paenibacillus sinopodophylli]
MNTNNDRLYAFKSITRLCCSGIQLEQRLNMPYEWMLITMAGTGAAITDYRY